MFLCGMHMYVQGGENSKSRELSAVPPFPLPLFRFISRPVLRAPYVSMHAVHDQWREMGDCWQPGGLYGVP